MKKIMLFVLALCLCFTTFSTAFAETAAAEKPAAEYPEAWSSMWSSSASSALNPAS